MCVCVHVSVLVRDHEGRNSPGRRRRRQHNKSSESSSLSSSVVNHSAAHINGDKENVQENGSNDFDDYVDDEEDTVFDAQTDREIKELSKMTDSGAAMVFLEELRKKKLEKASLNPWRSSRTPSAATEPPYKPRYDSPLFACE